MALILELLSYRKNAPIPPAPVTKVFGARGGTLGRAAASDWVLPDPERYVSGTHAIISCEDDIYYIEDSSTNGVFLNNIEQPLGKGRRVALKDGDLLYIGEYQISVCVTEELEESSAAEPDDIVVQGQAVDSFLAKHHISYFDEDSYDHLEDRESPHADELADGMPKVQREGLLENSSGRDQPSPPKSEATVDWVQQPLTEEPLSPENGHEKSDNSNKVPALSTDSSPLTATSSHTASGRTQTAGEEISEEWHEPIFTDESESIASQNSKVSFEPTTQTSSAERDSGRLEAFARMAKRSAPSNFSPEEASSLDSAQMLRAFLAGAGIKQMSGDTGDAVQTMELVGACMRELIQGLMDLLIIRAGLKKEFHITATIVQPIENNPLKFAMGVDEALPYLLAESGSSFMPALDAIREGIQDVKDHHWAMMIAMQTAFEDLLKQFDPDTLEACLAKDSKMGSLRQVNKMFRRWECYRDFYASLTKDPHHSFQRLFGEQFVRSYEEQIQRLSTVKDRSSD
jgi:type VI secretion system protein